MSDVTPLNQLRASAVPAGHTPGTASHGLDATPTASAKTLLGGGSQLGAFLIPPHTAAAPEWNGVACQPPGVDEATMAHPSVGSAVSSTTRKSLVGGSSVTCEEPRYPGSSQPPPKLGAPPSLGQAQESSDVHRILSYLDDIDRSSAVPPSWRAPAVAAAGSVHASWRSDVSSVCASVDLGNNTAGANYHQLSDLPAAAVPPIGDLASASAAPPPPLGLCSSARTGHPKSYEQDRFSDAASSLGFRQHRGGQPDAVLLGIRAKMDSMRAALDTSRRENAALKSALDEATARARGEIDRIREGAQRDVQSARHDSQIAVETHLKHIRELLLEKQSMTTKIERLTSELATAEGKAAIAAKRSESGHAAALNELKAKLATQDKAKREQWMAEETKKIKEATLKSMEPDIAMLLSRHKAEKKRLEEEVQDAIRQKNEAIAARDQEMASLKIRVMKDADDIVTREREAMRAKLDEERNRLDRTLDESRRGQLAKVESLERQLSDQRVTYERQIGELNKDLAAMRHREEDVLRRCREAVAQEVAALRTIHEEELRAAREAAEEAKRLVEAQKASEIETVVKQREESIRAQCAAERDREIETVLRRLEDEQVAMMREGRDATSALREKITSLQRDCERHLNEKEALQARITSLQDALQERQRLVEALRTERDNLAERERASAAAADTECSRKLHALDASWQQRCAAERAGAIAALEAKQVELQQALRRLDLSESERQAQSAVDAQKHQLELHMINERVAMTVAKKDQQLRAAAEHIAHLESELRERDSLLGQHAALLSA